MRFYRHESPNPARVAKRRGRDLVTSDGKNAYRTKNNTMCIFSHATITSDKIQTFFNSSGENPNLLTKWINRCTPYFSEVFGAQIVRKNYINVCIVCKLIVKWKFNKCDNNIILMINNWVYEENTDLFKVKVVFFFLEIESETFRNCGCFNLEVTCKIYKHWTLRIWARISVADDTNPTVWTEQDDRSCWYSVFWHCFGLQFWWKLR